MLSQELTFTSSVNVWLIIQVVILPILLPALVGLVTKFTTNSSLKAILLLLLSVVTAFITNLLAAYQNGVDHFDIGAAFLTAFATFAGGVVVHFGLLKPTGATAALQRTFVKDKVIEVMPTQVTDIPTQRGDSTK